MLALLGATPAMAADKTVTVNTGGPSLNARASATTASKILFTIQNKTKIQITCYVRGQAVSGGVYGVKNDTIWYKISGKNAYVWDGGLNTGSYNVVTGKCAPSSVKPTPQPVKASFKMPYPKGQSYRVTQSPNGGYSHGGDPYSRYAVDLANGKSGGSVVAAAAGKVYLATYRNVNGNYVLVDHGGDRCTYYGHLNTMTVKKGQKLLQGQKLGTVGRTGSATGPHIHFDSVYCSTQKSREIIRTVERGTSYPEGLWIKSQNG